MLAPRSRQQQPGSLAAAAIIVPLAILIAAPLMSLVYAYGEVYIPLRGWVTAILLGGFARGLAWVVDRAAQIAKCRSLVFVRTMGAVAGVFGIYCSWVAFTYVLLQRSSPEDDVGYFQIFSNPAGVLHFASEVASTGWYSIGAMTPSGVKLWILWAIEAAIVIAVPMLITGKFIGDTAYCVECDRWCTRESDLILTGMPATPVDRQLAASGDIAALSSLPPKPKDLSEPRVQIEMQSCPRCGETGALRGRVLEHKKDQKGKIKVTMSELIPLVLMTREERELLRKMRTPARAVKGTESNLG